LNSLINNLEEKNKIVDNSILTINNYLKNNKEEINLRNILLKKNDHNEEENNNNPKNNCTENVISKENDNNNNKSNLNKEDKIISDNKIIEKSDLKKSNY